MAQSVTRILVGSQQEDARKLGEQTQQGALYTDNMSPIGDRARARRLELGLSVPEVVERMGRAMSYQALQQLETGPSRGTKHIVALARALQVESQWLESGQGPKEARFTNLTEDMLRSGPKTSSDKVPIMGIAEGGDDGWSLWNGDVVGYVSRPSYLEGAGTAYAVYAVGTSMVPRYYPGETVFVNPGKPVEAGAFVLVQTRPPAEGEPPRALLKRLAKRTGIKLVLEQFQPAKTFDVPLKDVVSVHRVVGHGDY